MAGKHFDLDTNSDLGGDNPSDITIPSQKSIKTYVDTSVKGVNDKIEKITIVDELEGLQDVNISEAADGQGLVYDSASGKWVNRNVASGTAWGDITGSLSEQTDLADALANKANASHSHTYSDVGALSAGTVIPTVSNNYSASSEDAMSGKAVASAISAISIPSNTSDLYNDSDFVTSSDLSDYARSDDIPTNVSDLDNDAGYLVSSDLSEYALTTDIPVSVSQLANDAGYLTSDDISSAMIYKGSVDTYSELEDIENPKTGDVYNVIENGANYAWNGEAWDYLGETLDLSGYQTKNTAVTHAESTAVGNTITPIYVSDSGAATALNYTIAKSVPSDAKFSDTTYTAGSGLSLSGTQFKHTNSVTSGTAGTSAATSGSTLEVPYVTYDSEGHITAKGTHTHTVTGFLTEHQDISGKANASELADVAFSGNYSDLSGTPSIPSTYSDIGAASANHTHTYTDVGALSANTFIPSTYSDVNAASSGHSHTYTDVGAASASHTHSDLVPNTRKVNSKALSSDITLSASDVGALPSDTAIPSKTSDLNNDSGFITDDAIPSNVSAFNNDAGYLTSHQSLDGLVPTTRKVNNKALSSDITLSASDVNALPSSTSIPSQASDISAVPTSRKVAGKALTNDVTLSASDVGAASSTHTHTYSDVGAASSSHTHTYTQVGAASASHSHTYSDVGAASATHTHSQYLTEHQDISGKANVSETYTKSEIDGMISAGMHYKGTKASASALPSTGNQTGDLWNVEDTGANYAWNGTEWDKLSENVDLSGLVPNSRKVNNKALSSDITLTYSDVGALSSGTSIPSTYSDVNAASAGHTHTYSDVGAASASHTHSYSYTDVGAASASHTHSGYVPTSRTINTKALTSNITLSASDVGAATSGHTHTYSEVGALSAGTSIPSTYSDVNAASAGHTHTYSDVGALSAGTTIPQVTDTYSSTSTKAMSGKAVASAVAGVTYTSIGAASASHTHSYTYTDVGAASASHTHTYSQVGAASASHTHTYSDVGALSAGTSIPSTYSDVNAASASHTHTYTDVGAASSGHTHSGYVPTSRTINSKTLNANITLSYSDVGALSASTSIPSTYSDVGAASSAHTHTYSDVGAASSSHTHSGYQSTDTAVTHTKNTATGNTITPVYVASNGTATALSYTIAKSVPSDAKFSDTTYTAGSGISLSGTQFIHTNSVTSGTAGTSAATSGSTLAVPYVTYDSQGHITAKGTHTHTVTGFASSTHTHSYSDVGALSAGTSIPSTYSDVNAASAGHTHTYSQVGAASSSHTHTYSDVGAASSAHTHSGYVPTSRTINSKTLNANITLSYSDVGALSSGTSIPSTYSDVNAASAGHTHSYSYSDVGAASASHTHTYSAVGAASASHTHASNGVTALTGYAVATASAAISTADSLNVALGKLEYKINQAAYSDTTKIKVQQLEP